MLPDPTSATAPPSASEGEQVPVAPPTRPHLHLVPAPSPADPERSRRRAPGPGQQVLDLQFRLANGLAALPPLPRRLNVVGEDEDFGHRPTSRQHLPPAGAWVARLSVALVEALHGQRPAQQLVRWTTHEVLQGLQEQSRARHAHPSGPTVRRIGAPTAPARPHRYQVRSMRLEEPADGVVEASVLLVGPGRPIPLAIRLEGLDGRWICTVVDSPDRSVTGTAPVIGRDDEG